MWEKRTPSARAGVMMVDGGGGGGASGGSNYGGVGGVDD